MNPLFASALLKLRHGAQNHPAVLGEPLTKGEAQAILDALALISRVVNAPNGADQTGIDIGAETFALLYEVDELLSKG